MPVGIEGVLPAATQVGRYAVEGEVHLGQAPRPLINLLAVDGDVVAAAAVRHHEPLGLHEHPASSATRVVDPADVRLENLHEQRGHARWRVELATMRTLGAGSHRQEVLVHLARNVLGHRAFRLAQLNAAYPFH